MEMMLVCGHARARGGAGLEGGQESFSGGGDLLHGGLKGGLIHPGGMVEARDLADVLEGGVMDISLRGGRLEVEEGFNIAAHRNTFNNEF